MIGSNSPTGVETRTAMYLPMLSDKRTGSCVQCGARRTAEQDRYADSSGNGAMLCATCYRSGIKAGRLHIAETRIQTVTADCLNTVDVTGVTLMLLSGGQMTRATGFLNGHKVAIVETPATLGASHLALQVINELYELAQVIGLAATLFGKETLDDFPLEHTIQQDGATITVWPMTFRNVCRTRDE